MKKGLFFLLLTLLPISCMEDAQICVNEKQIDTNLNCDSVYNPVMVSVHIPAPTTTH